VRLRIQLLCAIAVVACAASAEAQPRRTKPKKPPHERVVEGEDAPFKTAIALYEAGKSKEAVAELEKIYATSKDARALLWMGRALQQDGQLAAALRAYKRHLAEAGREASSSPQGLEVMGVIQTLSMQVAVVTVNAPAGATIAVDDVEIGKAPLGEPYAIDPGKHTVRATLGSANATKTIDAVEEGRLAVDLLSEFAPPRDAAAPPEPAPPSAPASPPPAADARARASSGVDPIVVGGLGLATVLAVGSAYFTVKALGTASDFDKKKGELGTSRSELDDLQDEARLHAGLGVGLGVAALGVAGLTLFVLAPKKTNAGLAPAPPARRLRVTATGVTFEKSF
jgi:tetratricopeptide (TPR) repeat protein